MKVVTNTTFTPYSTDGVVIKPLHPVWILKNTGYYVAVINGAIRIKPGDFFGIDALPLMIPVIQSHMKSGEKIEIVNDTQFTINFPDVLPGGYPPQVTLIETSFTIVKD